MAENRHALAARPFQERSPRPLRAVIWDYDGTLVDTRAKNLSVTRSIVERVTGRKAREFPSLHDETTYAAAMERVANWRELYQREFSLNEDQTDYAGTLWTEYQSRDGTEIPFYGGIPGVLADLANLPHGIVSQNSRTLIRQQLERNGLLATFRSIVGYEEVEIRDQKPSPAGLLRCLEELEISSWGLALYVGDHEADARCAAYANQRLEATGVELRLRSVAALYGSPSTVESWPVQPYYQAYRVSDLSDIVQILTSGEPL